MKTTQTQTHRYNHDHLLSEHFDSVSIKTKLSEELLALELDPLQTTFDGNEAK